MTFRCTQHRLPAKLCRAIPFVTYSIIYIRLQFKQWSNWTELCERVNKWKPISMENIRKNTQFFIPIATIDVVTAVRFMSNKLFKYSHSLFDNDLRFSWREKNTKKCSPQSETKYTNDGVRVWLKKKITCHYRGCPQIISSSWLESEACNIHI